MGAAGGYAVIGTLISVLTIALKPGTKIKRLLVKDHPSESNWFETIFQYSINSIDIDTMFFLIFYHPMILILVTIHTYIMYSWSEEWAEMS